MISQTVSRIGKRWLLATAMNFALAAGAALASPIPSGTVATVTAHASSAGGQQFNYSEATIVNGVVTQQNLNQSTSGSSNGAGSITPGGTATAPSLSVTQNGFTTGGQMNTATTTASADLATGAIHLLVSPSGPEFFGSPSGFASGAVGDSVTFNNTSGQAVQLAVSFAADGTFSGPASGTSGVHAADAWMEFYSAGGPGAVQLLSSLGAHQAVGDYYAQYQYQGQNFPFPYTSFTDNGGAFAPLNQMMSLTDTSTATALNVVLGAMLYIPTGLSTIDIAARITTACDSGWTCDLSHTAVLGFGALPDGLTFTSGSGVFLSGPAASGGVPEPGVWALMLAGFAGSGLMLRAARRRGRLAV